jgi:hypothetical protein
MLTSAKPLWRRTCFAWWYNVLPEQVSNPVDEPPREVD